MTKKTWNKEHDTKTTQKNKEKKILSSSYWQWYGTDWPARHHACYVVDSDKSFWAADVLVSGQFRFQFLRFQLLGLVSYSTAFFILSFLVFTPFSLSLIQFRMSNHRRRLGMNDESSCNSLNVLDGLRYSFHCRLAYSHFLSVHFLGSLYSDLQPFFRNYSQPGVNGTLLSKNRKKKKSKQSPCPLITFLISRFWLPITRSIFIYFPLRASAISSCHPFSIFDLFNDPNMSIPALQFNAMHDDVIYWTWMRCAMIDWVNWLNWFMDFIEWMNGFPLPPLLEGTWDYDAAEATMYCKRLSWIFWITYSTLFFFFFFPILILILIFSLLSLQAFDLKRISDIYFVFFFSFFLSNFEYYLFYSIWIESFFLSAFSWTRTMMMVMLRWWTHSSCEWDVVDGLIDWWQNEWCFEFVLWLLLMIMRLELDSQQLVNFASLLYWLRLVIPVVAVV